MDSLMSFGRDMIVVAVAASCCEILLPEGESKRPVRFVFGLWFMALMLNPLVTLFTATDLSAIDIASLSDEELAAVGEEETDEEAEIYGEAARRLSEEFRQKLGALYEDRTFRVTARLEEKGVTSLSVAVGGEGGGESIREDILALAARDYGIPASAVEITFEGGGAR